MSKSRYSVDLVRQMAECDANYIRLLKLLPRLGEWRNGASAVATEESSMEDLATEFCVAVPGDDRGKVTVAIRVLQAFRYTTMLEIVQSPELNRWMPRVVMQVRVYHDANSAEVVSFQSHTDLQPRYPRPNPNMYHPDEKMQVNLFLGEWLSHCLRMGFSSRAPDLLSTV